MPNTPPIDGGGGGFEPGILGVSPTGALAFGSVAVGSTADIPIVVSNDGGFKFQVDTVTVAGAPYSLIGLPALPAGLNPGDSFTFTLRFSPTIAGTFNDNLGITASTIPP